MVYTSPHTLGCCSARFAILTSENRGQCLSLTEVLVSPLHLLFSVIWFPQWDVPSSLKDSTNQVPLMRHWKWHLTKLQLRNSWRLLAKHRDLHQVRGRLCSEHPKAEAWHQVEESHSTRAHAARLGTFLLDRAVVNFLFYLMRLTLFATLFQRAWNRVAEMSSSWDLASVVQLSQRGEWFSICHGAASTHFAAWFIEGRDFHD